MATEHPQTEHELSVHTQSVHTQSVHTQSVHTQSVHTQSVHTQSAHRHERAEDWGWHAELGRTARISGIVCVLLLGSLVLSSHGSRWELVWLIGFVVALVVSLVWDHNRRKNAWRS